MSLYSRVKKYDELKNMMENVAKTVLELISLMIYKTYSFNHQKLTQELMYTWNEF
jgi:hypothetical protein